MRGFFLLMAVIATLFGDDFITEYEYGQLLYSNPRGIGCDKCHGERGQGMIIASYYENNKKKVLATNPIWAMAYKDFKKALGSENGIMPKYFLTDGEVKALYHYLSEERKREE
ncbi:MAG: c-type cytochrome [Campylobacterales bacterium]